MSVSGSGKEGKGRGWEGEEREEMEGGVEGEGNWEGERGGEEEVKVLHIDVFDTAADKFVFLSRISAF